MSDARWIEAEEDVGAAARHFGLAVRLDEAGGFEDEGLDGDRARMGLMHAPQSGHASLEAAILRVFAILGEERPAGEAWHRDLIRRALAMHGHDGFEPVRAALRSPRRPGSRPASTRPSPRSGPRSIRRRRSPRDAAVLPTRKKPPPPTRALARSAPRPGRSRPS